jgi:hypothetical protein
MLRMASTVEGWLSAWRIVREGVFLMSVRTTNRNRRPTLTFGRPISAITVGDGGAFGDLAGLAKSIAREGLTAFCCHSP